ncbi:AI-2E family transporter [Agromyces sp. H3Y2-19a]|uniref:AI-2E family transporter n=2 Tax=Microbacteriaceae TaxID=85023 RepID=UPI001E4A244C|nr:MULTISPECIES: AI-2E family transporter [Agromyces]MCD5345608.1 AI-2E family transporter [Agromyces sp. S2-1-8]MDF0515484.1 AI-2E family transporter [Agromyces chromiiresistens]
MWWNKKHESAETDPAHAEGAMTAGTPVPHRNAFMLLGFAGLVITLFGIAAIGSVFSAVFLALVLVICVHPVRRGLERRGVPRGIATLLVLLTVVLLLGGFVFALVISFAQFATLLPEYAPEFESWATAASKWLSSLGVGQEQINALMSSFDPGKIVGALSGLVSSLLGGALGFISFAVILLTMLILITFDSSYVPTVVAGIGRKRPELATGLVRFASGVRRYMVATTGLGVAQGLVNWLALAIMGIPGAALWGMLSFLCSFIPNIGYFIAIVPPLVFGALVGGWPTVVAVIVVYGLINAVIQSIIQPKVVGNAVSLSQSLTFVSVLVWAVVLGPMGAILAVPLTLLVRMLLVDSNPSVGWVLPALGEVDDVKREMDEIDAEAKVARMQRREEKRHEHAAARSEGDPSPDDDGGSAGTSR